MPKRPLTRGEKWLFAIVVPLMSLLVGLGSLNAYINREPVVVIPTPIPTPQPNGYDLYVLAARTVRPANPPVDPVEDIAGATLSRTQKAQRYSLSRREAWLRANLPGLSLVKRAQSLPCRVPAMRATSAGRPVPARGFYDFARRKFAEVNTYKMRGQWDLAADTALDITQMGRDVCIGGDFDAWVFGRAVRDYGYLAFEDLPAHLNSAQARHAISRLESLYPHQELAKVMEEEKWRHVTDYLRIMQPPNWRQIPVWSEFTPSQRFRRRFLSKQKVIDDSMAASDYAIRILSAAPGAPLETPPQNLNEWEKPMIPVYQDYVLNRNIDFATPSLILYRLALRAYRVEHGTYPSSLDALVPSYLKHPYLDPFGNGKSPFHYRKQGDSYRLWSVGSDNVDNGGKSVPRIRRRNQILITWPAPVKGDNVVGP